MSIDDLTIGEAKQLASMFSGATNNAPHKMIGKVCVVRTYSAGVHIGKVVSVSGTEVELTESQRLWKWNGAFTLSEVANNGVGKESRMSMPTDIYLSQSIEIIPTTEKARESFKLAKQG